MKLEEAREKHPDKIIYRFTSYGKLIFRTTDYIGDSSEKELENLNADDWELDNGFEEMIIRGEV